MEKEKYSFKALVIIIVFTFFSCENQSADEKMLNEANYNFQYHQSDLLLEHINFIGPVVKNSVGKFKPNPKVKVFAWYYIHDIDTFWVYVEVAKNLKDKTAVSFSPNIDLLTENRENWSKIKPDDADVYGR